MQESGWKGSLLAACLTSAVNWNGSTWPLPFDLNGSWLVSQRRQKSCFLLLKWNACFQCSIYWGRLREGKGKASDWGWLQPRGSKCGAKIVRAGRVQQMWRWGDLSCVPTDPPHCASRPGFLPSCPSFSLREMLPCPLQKWKCRSLPRCFGGWPLVGCRSVILLPMTDQQSSGESAASPRVELWTGICANGHHRSTQMSRWCKGSNSPSSNCLL